MRPPAPPVDELLAALPGRVLTAPAEVAAYGTDASRASLDGLPVAIGRYRSAMLHPLRVFHLDGD